MDWFVCIQPRDQSYHTPNVLLCGHYWTDSFDRVWMFLFLLITVGNRDSRYRSGVAAQEEERHVASSGHQVDQHGHADSTQSWQVQLLHQQPPEEDTQTGTGDGCHACRGQDKGVGFAFTLKSQCSSIVFSSINTFSINAKFVFPFIYFVSLYLDCQICNVVFTVAGWFW